eukprot:3111632-Pyramimonas_sp.AAC.1
MGFAPNSRRWPKDSGKMLSRANRYLTSPAGIPKAAATSSIMVDDATWAMSILCVSVRGEVGALEQPKNNHLQGVPESTKGRCKEMAFHHEDDTVTAVEAICQGTIEALRDDLQARLQVCVRHAVLALCNPENAEVVEKLFESPKDRVQRVIKEGGGDFQSHIPVALFRRLKALSS